MVVPNVHQLVPKLDKMVKDRMSQGAVKMDQSLARLQLLCVDATGPFASLVEQGNHGDLMVEKAVAVPKTARRFMGNVTLQYSKER